MFSTMSESDCRAFLARTHVGRIAFVHHGQVDIRPVHFAIDGNWIVTRTARGEKLAALLERPYVAFEVDESDAQYDWRSVIVRGTIYPLEGDVPGHKAEQWERALAALRRFMPVAMSSDDPTPQRDVILGLHIDELTGRSASLA